MWWYLSFADSELPTGEQWLGACVVSAPSAEAAVMVAHLLKCNPGGEVMLHPIESSITVPLEFCERLLTREDLDQLEQGALQQWASDS